MAYAVSVSEEAGPFAAATMKAPRAWGVGRGAHAQLRGFPPPCPRASFHD